MDVGLYSCLARSLEGYGSSVTAVAAECRISRGHRDRVVSLRRELAARYPGHFRLRYDTTDSKGTMTLRRAARLYHLSVGAAHANRIDADDRAWDRLTPARI